MLPSEWVLPSDGTHISQSNNREAHYAIEKQIGKGAYGIAYACKTKVGQKLQNGQQMHGDIMKAHPCDPCSLVKGWC